MNLNKNTSEIYIPDGATVEEALARTTHLCIAAHQDDIEIMAAQPIIECFHDPEKWFTGVLLTNGRGSPRDGVYAQTTDEEMRLIRMAEQRKAAYIGNYSAMIFLDYPSYEVKQAANSEPVEDLLQILHKTLPEYVYTHNLADKHDTHIAVVLRAIQALRRLESEEKPEKVIACEVWRSLDWVSDDEKVVMDLSNHLNQQEALLGVFDSQIAGGKRYDLAAMSRRQANATFFESHDVDVMIGASFGMDLTPLMNNPSIPPLDFIDELIQHFGNDVRDRINRLG
jgi:LmbE family N-acetylglucosaminyl deacetylase